MLRCGVHFLKVHTSQACSFPEYSPLSSVHTEQAQYFQSTLVQRALPLKPHNASVVCVDTIASAT